MGLPIATHLLQDQAVMLQIARLIWFQWNYQRVGIRYVNNATEHLIKSQRNLNSISPLLRMSPLLLQRPGTEERVWKNA